MNVLLKRSVISLKELRAELWLIGCYGLSTRSSWDLCKQWVTWIRQKMTCHTVVYAMHACWVQCVHGKGKIILPVWQCMIFTKHVHRNKNTLAETRRVTCTCGQTKNIAPGEIKRQWPVTPVQISQINNTCFSSVETHHTTHGVEIIILWKIYYSCLIIHRNFLIQWV